MNIHMASEVWVTAAFVKPGTHTYMIGDQRDGPQPHHTNIHECIVEEREENIAVFERVTKKKDTDMFHKWKTIFASWPVENDLTFKQCIEHDVKMWKVTRLVKDS